MRGGYPSILMLKFEYRVECRHGNEWICGYDYNIINCGLESWEFNYLFLDYEHSEWMFCIYNAILRYLIFSEFQLLNLIIYTCR